MEQSKRDWVTPREAGELIGAGRDAVIREIKAGRIYSYISPRGHHRILRKEVDRYLLERLNRKHRNGGAS